jgi:hypothetical protein
MFRNRGARFHPIAAIHIEDRPCLPDHRVMDMAAYDNLRLRQFYLDCDNMFADFDCCVTGLIERSRVSNGKP